MDNKLNMANVESDFERHKDRHNEGGKVNTQGWVKWVIIGICIIAAALIFIIPFSTRSKPSPVLMPADIEKITIYKEGTAGTTFSYTNPEKIDKLTNYLTSVDLKTTTRTPNGPDILTGGEWQIRILGKEGICEIIIVGSTYYTHPDGDEYFQHPDGTWYMISQAQAVKFEELLKTMIPDELPRVKLFDEWV